MFWVKAIDTLQRKGTSYVPSMAWRATVETLMEPPPPLTTNPTQTS